MSLKCVRTFSAFTERLTYNTTFEKQTAKVKHVKTTAYWFQNFLFYLLYSVTMVQLRIGYLLVTFGVVHHCQKIIW